MAGLVWSGLGVTAAAAALSIQGPIDSIQRCFGWLVTPACLPPWD